MRQLRLLLAVGVLGFILLAVTVHAVGKENRVGTVTIMAESLKNNLLKEPLEQDLVVCLPPSYFETQKRYPVVYYLHGFTRYPDDIASYAGYFDAQMKGSMEFIVVGVNGHNKLAGSFYVNSPVTGNWEDFVIKEVVPYIDAHYRTLAKSEARGISGWSMGGFAAINLAFRHPDVFSSVYSITPGLFDEKGLREAYGIWDQTFITAYGAAFSPNLSKRYPYSDAPKFNDTDADNAVRANWENGFGNLRQKIEDYRKLKTPLKAIQIWYGKSDYYTWIPKGCVYFSDLLNEYGIPHELKQFPGGHEQGILKDTYVPFFSAHLAAE